MIVPVWLVVGALVSFVVGWAIGTYGYSVRTRTPPEILIAIALADTNRMVVR